MVHRIPASTKRGLEYLTDFSLGELVTLESEEMQRRIKSGERKPLIRYTCTKPIDWSVWCVYD